MQTWILFNRFLLQQKFNCVSVLVLNADLMKQQQTRSSVCPPGSLAQMLTVDSHMDSHWPPGIHGRTPLSKWTGAPLIGMIFFCQGVNFFDQVKCGARVSELAFELLSGSVILSLLSRRLLLGYFRRFLLQAGLQAHRDYIIGMQAVGRFLFICTECSKISHSRVSLQAHFGVSPLSFGAVWPLWT